MTCKMDNWFPKVGVIYGALRFANAPYRYRTDSPLSFSDSPLPRVGEGLGVLIRVGFLP